MFLGVAPVLVGGVIVISIAGMNQPTEDIVPDEMTVFVEDHVPVLQVILAKLHFRACVGHRQVRVLRVVDLADGQVTPGKIIEALVSKPNALVSVANVNKVDASDLNLA